SVSAATASTSTSAPGAQDRSRRRPSPSRTTTMASGPDRASPASPTAWDAVVPAGILTRAGGGVGTAEEDTGCSLAEGDGLTRRCYRPRHTRLRGQSQQRQNG